MNRVAKLVFCLVIGVVCLGGLGDAFGEVNWKEKLQATDAQMEVFKKINHFFKRKEIMLKAQLQIAMMDLMRVLEGVKPSEKEALAAIEKVGRLELELKKQHVLRLVRLKAKMSRKQSMLFYKITKANREKKKKLHKKFRQWKSKRLRR